MKELWEQIKNAEPAAIWKAAGIIVIFTGAILFYITQNQQPEAEVSFNLDDGAPVNAEAEESEQEDSGEIKVDVKGAVAYPGVYSASGEQRVEELIAEAGGPEEDAAMESVNLAQKVHDEMIIYVPSAEEADNAVSAAGSPENNSGVSMNRADQAEWETLPGIGPAKAAAIIQYRDEHGPFSSIESLTEVPGIGEKTLESLRDQLTLH